MNQGRTCSTCKHLNSMDECKPLHEAVAPDLEQRGYGCDSWSEVVSITVDDPKKFGCVFYERKNNETP